MSERRDRRERWGMLVMFVGAPLAALAAHLTFTPVGVLDGPVLLAVMGLGALIGWSRR